MTDKRIKILKCSNFILWYRQYIGQEFEVLRDEKTAWWVREREHPYALNWVYKTDSEVI